MSIGLAAIADDYTGASDLANTWRRQGLRTVQTIGVPDAAVPLEKVDALVVALKIRSVPAEQAVAKALEAEAWLRARGARHIVYKVCSTFDSTDAGNIGPVTDALRDRAGVAATVVTPAFPETARTVFKGHLFVGDVLLSDSPLRHHPLNPMTDPSLVRVLARQSRAGVGLIDLDTVRAGREAIAARIAAGTAEGVESFIADAVAEADLVALGEVALGMAVSTGASGLGLGLARAHALGIGRPAGAFETQASLGGPGAVLVGSCSARTLEQVAAAEKIMPVLRLDAGALIESGGDISEALGWARSRLADGPVAIVASGDPETVAEVQARHGRLASGHAVEAAMAGLATGLVEAGLRRLVVAGGETSGAVVDALGVPALAIGAEIAPGVPALRAIGWDRGALGLVLKSGNFGDVGFFEKALAAL